MPGSQPISRPRRGSPPQGEEIPELLKSSFGSVREGLPAHYPPNPREICPRPYLVKLHHATRSGASASPSLIPNAGVGASDGGSRCSNNRAVAAVGGEPSSSHPPLPPIPSRAFLSAARCFGSEGLFSGAVGRCARLVDLSPLAVAVVLLARTGLLEVIFELRDC
uniref:Uncharacterized protein n=1 Tax=Oryza punctata TaxID=4537 RepID=A0A0E0K4P9_ORYPU